MNKWLLGARLRTLPAAIAPVLVAVAIALPEFNLLNALLCLIVGLSMVMIKYLLDIVDNEFVEDMLNEHFPDTEIEPKEYGFIYNTHGSHANK